MQNCSSAAQAKMPPNASAVPPEIESELQTCIGRCEADVLAKIPQFFARLQEVVNQAK